MNILCVMGQHNYGDPTRGAGYEYANFIPAFRRLGHHVTHFESWNKRGYTSFADLNRQLLIEVERRRPDLIFCVLMGYEIWIETLDLIRQRSDAVIVNWATDDSWKYDQHSRFVLPCFDVYATTYPDAQSKATQTGFRHVVLTQWGANPDTLHEPISASECRWDVSFVGTAYGNRTRWVSELKARHIRVQCFGKGWDHGPVSSETIPEIIRQSRISLNFGDSNWMFKGMVPYRSRQIKARVFEVPGCGGFLMTESAPRIDRFYEPQKEIVVFDSIDDLTKKIRYFLSHPEQRDRIARAGYRKTRDLHTYDRRFAQLLQEAQAIMAQRSPQRPRPDHPRIVDRSIFDRLALPPKIHHLK